MMIRPTALLAVILATAIALAGCSGSGDAKSTKKSKRSDKKAATDTEPESDVPCGQGPASKASASGQGKQWDEEPVFELNEACSYTATVTTNKGAFTIQLLPDEGRHAVNNFVFLARQGFYNGVVFHRIIKDFMAQTGDPDGTGMGGPGYNIEDDPVESPYQVGSVAMANTGQPNSGGSQFFVVTGEQGVALPGSYSLFGKVTKGMDVVAKIASTPVTNSDSGEPSKPTTEVKMTKIVITEAPA